MKKALRITSLIFMGQLISILAVAQGATSTVDYYPVFPGKNPADLLSRTPGQVASLQLSPNGSRSRTISSCDCWVERDRAWQVAAFMNGQAPDYRNDDGSTDTITLVSPFCFYGQYLRKLFINNNGNISFGTSYATYSSDSFPNTNFVMVAPFWADVDTRGPGSGIVWYEQTNSHLIVQWDSVGYFNSQEDKLNSFQLIITDGLDPLLPAGYNVSFCYKDMAWTTGSASQGVNGFGGIPATVGINQGNGVNFIQMGRFDQPGSAYDGPSGAYDGIDFLDNQSFIFNTCVSNFNISPVISSLSACDTIVMCVGDSTTIGVQFLAPESNQQTTPSVNLGNLQDAIITSLVSGAVASAEVSVLATNNNLGFHTITFTGTDNGTPARSTNTPVTIRVIGQPTAGLLMIPDTGTTVFFDNRSLNYLISYIDFGDGTAGYCYFDT
ncbi:MAG: nidogen-like domain-containing protein, partial [Bacteroidota bacterium]